MFAVCILRFKLGFEVLEWMGHRVNEFMHYSEAGAMFVFGDGYKEHMVVFSVRYIIIYYYTFAYLSATSGAIASRKVLYILAV